MHAAITETTSNLSPLAGKRILIADRNNVTRSVMRDTCYTLGAESVHYATSGQEVLRAVSQREVQVILCEYLLDEIRDGQQVLEELRTQKLMSSSVIFMMITAERTYKQVVAVAEFVPDDYLIKPFTTEKFRLRLVRANEKKQIFSRAYAFLEKNAYTEALTECLNIAKHHKRFLADAYRQVIDIYLASGRIEEAEELLFQVLAVKAIPWAQMELAVIRQRQGRVEEAEKILAPLVETKRDFLSAYDRLASVKEELGKEAEALAILEKAAALSSMNVNRLRRTAGLAQRTGDLDKAEHLFKRILDRVRDSSMLEGNDLVNLSNVLIAQGKFEQAEKVAAEQRRLMKGHPNQEFVGTLIEYQQATQTGQKIRAAAAAERLLHLLACSESGISPQLQLKVLEASFSHRHTDTAIAIALRLAKNSQLDKFVIQRVQKLLDDYHRQQLEAKGLIAIAQISAAIAHLNKSGWDDKLAERIQFSMAFWQKSGLLSADDAEGFRLSFGAVASRFGITSAT